MAEAEDAPPDSLSTAAKEEGKSGGGDVGSKKSDTKTTKTEKTSKSKEDLRNPKKKNCCQKCCSKLMKIAANDAIYGSFFGPHPVSFLCFCVPCKKGCDEDCIIPFAVASIATKLMYFIMLGIVSLVAALFVFPWPQSWFVHESTVPAKLFPCQNGKLVNENMGCMFFAGYFMAYRCFLGFSTLMVINSIIMTYITNTEEDESRAKIHRGFWFYKYLALAGLILMYSFVANGYVDEHGYFEYTLNIMGNIAHLFFSFLIITSIMDTVELWVIENKTSNSKWANFLYWILTIGIIVFDLIFLCSIVWNFSAEQTFPRVQVYYPNGTSRGDEGGDEWPHNNCVEGSRETIDWRHFGMIIGMLGVIMLVLIVVSAVKDRRKDRFPYLGWLQVAVLAAINLFYLWSALYSSTNVNSRPRCNWALYYFQKKSKFTRSKDDIAKETLQEGNHDSYARLSGTLHGFFIIFGLAYYAFVHGPRSKTAPLSILFRHIWGDDNKIPVYPDVIEGPKEFQDAVINLNVWDDERDEVVYSWSKFYYVMAFGSFSLMMAITNFTDATAKNYKYYNSSNLAFGFKYGTAIMASVIYIALLIFPCSRIYPGYEPHKKVKTLKVVVDDEENVMEQEVIEEEEYEELEEVVEETEPDVPPPKPKRVSVEKPTPQKCGCLM